MPRWRTASSWAYTGKPAAARVRCRPDSHGRASRGAVPAYFDRQLFDLVRQLGEVGIVGLGSSLDQDVEPRLAIPTAGQQLEPSRFTQPPFEPVAVDDVVTMPWNHQRYSGAQNRGSVDEHVQMVRPFALPPTIERPDLRPSPDPGLSWKPIPASRWPFYFLGVVAARRLRPLRRRRARILRPDLVLWRARKPCLRRRLRFRGR